MREYTGSVKFFLPEKDYGFIMPIEGGEDVFLPGSHYCGDHDEDVPEEGMIVTYEKEIGKSGRPRSRNVRRVRSAPKVGDRVQGIVKSFSWKDCDCYGFITVPHVPGDVFLHAMYMVGSDEQIVRCDPGVRVCFTLVHGVRGYCAREAELIQS